MNNDFHFHFQICDAKLLKQIPRKGALQSLLSFQTPPSVAHWKRTMILYKHGNSNTTKKNSSKEIMEVKLHPHALLDQQIAIIALYCFMN